MARPPSRSSPSAESRRAPGGRTPRWRTRSTASPAICAAVPVDGCNDAQDPVMAMECALIQVSITRRTVTRHCVVDRWLVHAQSGVRDEALPEPG